VAIKKGGAASVEVYHSLACQRRVGCGTRLFRVAKTSQGPIPQSFLIAM